MKIRKLLAGTFIAGTLLGGPAATAAALAGTAAPPAAAQQARPAVYMHG